jgi:hypothetical protein
VKAMVHVGDAVDLIVWSYSKPSRSGVWISRLVTVALVSAVGLVVAVVVIGVWFMVLVWPGLGRGALVWSGRVGCSLPKSRGVHTVRAQKYGQRWVLPLTS